MSRSVSRNKPLDETPSRSVLCSPMAGSDDDTTAKRPPKVVKFVPKGASREEPKEEPRTEPVVATKFETAADEWVQSEIGMTALAKKWKVSRATVYRWRTEQNWDARKKQFARLVEEKKVELAATPPPARADETKDDPTEATRQARVDETAADKKAQAEIVLHEIAYAMTGALASAMDRDSVANLDKPKSLSELFRTGKDVAIFHKMVIGDPEPPPKPLQIFEVQFQTRGGAINTIERLGSETLEDAMARLRKEYAEAEERLISSFMEPVGRTSG